MSEDVTYYTLVAFIFLYFIFTKRMKTHKFYSTATIWHCSFSITAASRLFLYTGKSKPKISRAWLVSFFVSDLLVSPKLHIKVWLGVSNSGCKLKHNVPNRLSDVIVGHIANINCHSQFMRAISCQVYKMEWLLTSQTKHRADSDRLLDTLLFGLVHKTLRPN